MHESPSDLARLQEERRVLGAAAQRLAGALDFGDTLQQALAACLPAVGDFGFFDVVISQQEVRRTVAAHQAPHVEALLAPTRWVRQVHPELNLCGLSTGEAALHPDIDEGWYRQVAASDAHLRLLRELAFRSMITIPLRFRGELLGALTLFMGASGRRHGARDLALAGDLALLAAPVVANARLVAQHEATEAALRQSSRQLQMAVEAGRVGIWDWDIASNRVSWSRELYQMHGVEIGSDTGGLEGFRARVHPEDLERVEQALRSALAGGSPYEAEFRTYRDGRLRWISTRSTLVRDAEGKPLRMVGASTDITERMELLAAERVARAEAEEARRRFELLATAGDLLARQSLDLEDTLSAVASVLVPEIADWCRIDLLDEHGVLQRRLAHHRDPRQSDVALAMARQFPPRADTPGSMAWCVRHSVPFHGHFGEPPISQDPGLREYARVLGLGAFFVVPLVARGRTIGAMRVAQAESGREISVADRALIQELAYRAALALDNARAYAEADAARRQAENASRAKDEFLAMLGHELRNPLAPIITALELMARREPGAHVEERRIVHRQVSHLSRLIDDLLDVSRITQGKVDLQRVPLDLRSVVAHALEQTQPLLARRAQPPEVEVPDGPVPVLGDATRLTQVLCNLLVNASKFTPPDGRIRVTLCVQDQEGQLSVEDTGRGISPELLPRVFELFVQGRQSLDRQSGGLGLGLAIVRMLVEMHGGRVSAHSEGEGRGSRFAVHLPLHAQLGDATEPASAAAVGGKAGAGARVLVVDDNTDAAETLADLLRVLGYEVKCAGDGPAATALLERFLPQLALLDIGLPGEDGYAVARRLRADPRLANVRLVALTGYGQEEDRQRALAGGFDEHLVKPVRAERLLQVLEQFVPAPG